MLLFPCALHLSLVKQSHSLNALKCRCDENYILQNKIALCIVEHKWKWNRGSGNSSSSSRRKGYASCCFLFVRWNNKWKRIRLIWLMKQFFFFRSLGLKWKQMNSALEESVCRSNFPSQSTDWLTDCSSRNRSIALSECHFQFGHFGTLLCYKLHDWNLLYMYIFCVHIFIRTIAYKILPIAFLSFHWKWASFSHATLFLSLLFIVTRFRMAYNVFFFFFVSFSFSSFSCTHQINVRT